MALAVYARQALNYDAEKSNFADIPEQAGGEKSGKR
jgi:hypothetical protein